MPPARQPTHFTGWENVVFGSSGFPVAVQRRTPQASYPRHTHEFTELVIVTAGTGMHLAARERWPLTRGDVLLVKPGAAHAYSRTSRLSLINVSFHASPLGLSDEEIAELGPVGHALRPKPRHAWGLRLHLAPASLEQILQIVQRLESELKSRGVGFRRIVSALLNEILVHLARGATLTDSTALPDSNSDLRRAIACIEENPAEQIDLTTLAARVHSSPRTLHRRFKAAFGFGPHHYRIYLRLQEGCRLLQDTDATVTEIAYRLGFEDGNYFSRLFHRHIGMSPKAFQRKPQE
jgi:AraC-like DNA-binding protein/mannose-6-phosphate isomerase-like protein (cupin superfamily)